MGRDNTGPESVSASVMVGEDSEWSHRLMRFSDGSTETHLACQGGGHSVHLFLPRSQIARLRAALEVAQQEAEGAEQEAREDAYLRGDDSAGHDTGSTDGAGDDADVQD